MKLVALPTPPSTLLLGGLPKFYYSDHKYTVLEDPSNEYTYLATVPLSETITTDELISHDVKFKLVQEDASKTPLLEVTKSKLSEGQRLERADKIKHHLASDLITNGLPIGIFDEKVEIKWADKVYIFEPDDLAALDLFRYPYPEHQYRTDLPSFHSLGLAGHPCKVPALINNKFGFVDLQRKLATETLNRYWDVCHHYVENLNLVLELIENYEFGETENTITDLWNGIYGTENQVDTFIGKTPRIHLS